MGAAANAEGKVLICGGCLVTTGDATNAAYESHLKKPAKVQRKKSMARRRYGHVCVNLNGYIYALGGFDSKDADGVEANSIDQCERFSFHENKWLEVCSMNESRAFHGACSMGEQFIFVFGGFQGFEVLPSIEKYDSVLDNWLTLYVKLPTPLSKMGVTSLDQSRLVLVVGGMDGVYTKQRATWQLDLKSMKFKALADMKVGKTLGGSLFHNEGFVYAIGGNEKDVCEKYDTYNNKWELMPTYSESTQAKELSTFAMVHGY